MRDLLINIKCKPGQTYEVADKIYLRFVEDLRIGVHLFSTSGKYDLFLHMRPPQGEDIGRFLNEHLLKIKGIERTETTIAFHAF